MAWQPPQGGIMSLLPQQPPSFQLNGVQGGAQQGGAMPPWLMQHVLNHYAYQPAQTNQGMQQNPYAYQSPQLQNPFQPRAPVVPGTMAPPTTAINAATQPAQAQSGIPGGFASVDDWLTAMQTPSAGGGGSPG